LNLEGNNIGDVGAIELFGSLKTNTYLKKLNLSKNKLTNACTPALSEMLMKNDTLEELYLYMNVIQSEGAITLFNGLKKNNSIRVLDLSWNTIGANERGLGKAFFELFSTNNSLVHCDFSFNKISYQTTEQAAKGLEENHTIYGLHWLGNEGYIDTEGFLIPSKRFGPEYITLHPTISKPRIDGFKCVINPKHYDKATPKENCWICEGWQEITVTYFPGILTEIISFSR